MYAIVKLGGNGRRGARAIAICVGRVFIFAAFGSASVSADAS